jgi:hypothetical protein
MNALLSSGEEEVPDGELEEELQHMEELLLPSVPTTKIEQHGVPNAPTKVQPAANKFAEPLLAEPGKSSKKIDSTTPAKEAASELAQRKAARAPSKIWEGDAMTKPARAIEDDAAKTEQKSATVPEAKRRLKQDLCTQAEEGMDQGKSEKKNNADLVRNNVFLSVKRS